MFDRRLQAALKRPLDRLAAGLQRAGLSANTVSVIGFAIGVLGCGAIALQEPVIALVLLGLNRLCDGLDGALALRLGATDLGGYLDIVLDFLIYSGVVFAHAVAYPEHALAAAFLIFSFVGTGSSFLAYAIMEEKRRAARNDLTHPQKPQAKSFFYLGGLTEGFETIVALGFGVLMPGLFPWMAWIFGALCWLTTATRIGLAIRHFRPLPEG